MSVALAPLENAISRLSEAIEMQARHPADALIRDGLVQRFEFTYEMSHRTLKRYLESVSPTPDLIDQTAFPDLIRSASEQGLLLGDWPRWRTFRDMRAKTSHAYDEAVALAVVAGIPGFLEEARHLCDELRRRQAQRPA